MFRDLIGDKGQGEQQQSNIGSSSSSLNPISNAINRFVGVSGKQSDFLSNNNVGQLDEVDEREEFGMSGIGGSADLSHLNQVQLQKMKQRSAILGKQIHPEKNDAYIEQQV